MKFYCLSIVSTVPANSEQEAAFSLLCDDALKWSSVKPKE